MAVDTGRTVGPQTEEIILERPHGAEGGEGPSVGGWVARGALWTGLAFMVLVLPLLLPGFRVKALSEAAIFAIIGLSLNVLVGYAGQISLGHQAFVGIGAFTSAYLVTNQGQSFYVAVLAAALLGAAQALVLGGVALRIRGLYFALITLSYGVLTQESFFGIRSLTGGDAGVAAPRPDLFRTSHRYYYLCLLFLAVVVWVDWRMMRSKGGRALLALRENPRVAATMGINVQLFTLLSFVVSGVFAGLGGALYAHELELVDRGLFDFRLALVFIIMTVVGGLRNRTGVILGSAFFALLPTLIEVIPGVRAGLANIPGAPVLSPEIGPFVIGPVLLLLTLTTFPGGIGQQIKPITGWLRGGRFDIHAGGEKEVVAADVRA